MQPVNRQRWIAKEDIRDADDATRLGHTKWDCQYHIVFAPKNRKKVFYAAKRVEIRKIPRGVCNGKQIEILEAEVCADHIHMLLAILPKMPVARVVGYLKGKGTRILHRRHGNLKYKHGSRTFWYRGYCVDTAGKNKKKIAEHIPNQLKEDQVEHTDGIARQAPGKKADDGHDALEDTNAGGGASAWARLVFCSTWY